jgi:hypothetical protein
MSRKTLKVDDLREAANVMLAAPGTPENPEQDAGIRMGIALLLERVLFDTDNYKGYKHLPSEWDAEAEKLREGHDATRRQYF